MFIGLNYIWCFGFCFKLLLFIFSVCIIVMSFCHFRSSSGGGDGGGSRGGGCGGGGDGGGSRGGGCGGGGGDGTRCGVFTALLLKISHFWDI
jgi:hypothetical protein